MSMPNAQLSKQQAYALFQQRRFAEARALCHKITRKNKKDIDIWFLLGAIEGALGQFREAEHWLKKVTTAQPSNAQAHYNLGVARHQQKHFDAAIASFEQAVRLQPALAEAHYNLGLARHETGDLAGAQQSFEQVIRLRPDLAQAYSDLGNVLKTRGESAAAVDRYREALRLKPDSVEVLINLGIALRDLDRLEEAQAAIDQALALQPGHAGAHLQKGNLLHAQEDHQSALDAYRKAIELEPGYAEAHYNLGVALRDLDRTGEAIDSFRRALQYKPDYVDALFNLGNTFLDVGSPEEAVAEYRKALAYRPDYVELLFNLGVALQALGQHLEGAEYLAKAVELRPDYTEAHVCLASALQTINRVDEALDHYDRALALEPDNADAIGGKAAIHERRGQFAEARTLIQPYLDGTPPARIALVYGALGKPLSCLDEAIAAMERSLELESTSGENRIDLYFALGKLYDRLGDYDKAFAHYRAGNEAFRRKNARLLEAYHPGIDAGRMQALMDAFGEGFAERLAGSGSDSQRPLFVVGMPRSGTTLTEQILASHPAVYGAGELPDISRLRQTMQEAMGTEQAYPALMERVTPDLMAGMATRYLQRLDGASTQADRVVDKMPHNFLHLGLIAMLFPRARIIHVSREPADTCLSIYFQKFNCSHAYASDLAHLGAYYRSYQRLMDHWRKVLPLPLFELRYDELVADPEPVIRAMLEHCGLDWDDRCLQFHATRRDVNTPSYDQVRQPLYNRSSGRWTRYRAHLAPLLEALTP